MIFVLKRIQMHESICLKLIVAPHIVFGRVEKCVMYHGFVNYVKTYAMSLQRAFIDRFAVTTKPM